MKVSIITVSFNSASTIADTIKSVLNQTYKNIEYWIIDGQSNDGTIDIIKKYEKVSNGRLHWISEKDKGIYDAMNKGIKKSTGNIIGILNSDDFFTSNNVIEDLVANFTDDIDAIYGDVHFVKSNNLQKNVRYYSGRVFKPWMARFGFIPPHPSFYVRRSILDKYGYFIDKYKISADFELIVRLCNIKKIKTKYLHLDFVTMRIGGASTKNLKARIQGTKEALHACKQLGIKSNLFFIHLKYLIKISESIFIKK